jgi:hypothetical protein
MKQLTGAFLVLLLLASCNRASKKILIVTRGDISVSGNNITVTAANNYSELSLTLSGSAQSELKVTAPAGDLSVVVPGPGCYILNIRQDTLLGARQQIGRDFNTGQVLSQENLKQKIDSLQKLLAGSNVSAANRNFQILPNRLQLITDNLQAKIVGPFQLIPATLDPGPDGKGPELYKFYTSGEMRDMIANAIRQTETRP